MCKFWVIPSDFAVNSVRSKGSYDLHGILLIVISDRVNGGIRRNGPKCIILIKISY